MALQLDFVTQFNKYINTLGLYAKSVIGVLAANESISVMSTPGGPQQLFYDGSRDKDFQVQITTKSKEQANCINALNYIFLTLENLEQLPSTNNSYEFYGIDIASLPSFVTQDDQGYFIWQLSISAKLNIKKGVL